MQRRISPKTIRRLTAAEGYLELNMPQQAIAELDAIENAGPYQAVVELMRGKALTAQKRYDEAIAPLERAARMMPPPHNKDIWLSLSQCFRLGGQERLAEMVETLMNTTQVPELLPLMNITIMIHMQPPLAAGTESSDGEDSFDE